MKDTGFIRLPLIERTLHDYTHVFPPKTGIQPEVNDQLATEAKLDEIEAWQKHVVVVFDEIKVKEGLIYDKFSGSIIGFTDLGDTTKYIDELERSMDEPNDVASSMLVFMIRGLFIKLNFPYAQIPMSLINC